MLSDGLASFLLGVGIAGFVYSKLAKSNGNANPGSNATVATIVGLVALFFMFTILKFILHIG